MKISSTSSVIALGSALLATSASANCWSRPFGLNSNERAAWAMLPGVSLQKALGLKKMGNQPYCSSPDAKVDVYHLKGGKRDSGLMCLVNTEEQILRCGAAGRCCTTALLKNETVSVDAADIRFHPNGTALPQEQVLATIQDAVNKLNATILATQNATVVPAQDKIIVIHHNGTDTTIILHKNGTITNEANATFILHTNGTITNEANNTTFTLNNYEAIANEANATVAIQPQFMEMSDIVLEYGSCGFPVDFSNSSLPVVALNKEDFGGLFQTAACNECVEITRKNQTVIARIASMCEVGCEPGKLQLSKKDALVLEPKIEESKRAKVTYTKVACPLEFADGTHFPIVTVSA